MVHLVTNDGVEELDNAEMICDFVIGKAFQDPNIRDYKATPKEWAEGFFLALEVKLAEYTDAAGRKEALDYLAKLSTGEIILE